MAFEASKGFIGLFFLIVRHIGVESLKGRDQFLQTVGMRFGDGFVGLKIIDGVAASIG
jgi:hypothetical protein